MRPHKRKPQSAFKVGDKVEVLCPGLAMLRAIVPDAAPNHHGIVEEIWKDGSILVEFPNGDHSQSAPYPPDQIRLRP